MRLRTAAVLWAVALLAGAVADHAQGSGLALGDLCKLPTAPTIQELLNIPNYVVITTTDGWVQTGKKEAWLFGCWAQYKSYAFSEQVPTYKRYVRPDGWTIHLQYKQCEET